MAIIRHAAKLTFPRCGVGCRKSSFPPRVDHSALKALLNFFAAMRFGRTLSDSWSCRAIGTLLALPSLGDEIFVTQPCDTATKFTGAWRLRCHFPLASKEVRACDWHVFPLSTRRWTYCSSSSRR